MKAGFAFLALLAAASGPPPRTVLIQAMHYGAVPGGLHAGDTLLFVNRDIVPHTVTARDHSFDVVVQPGQSGRIVLGHAGAIGFFCRFHPAMQGSLAVAAR